MGALPAPAPRPARLPSTTAAPSSMAARELPMARPRLLWAWKPTSQESPPPQRGDLRPHLVGDHGPGGVHHVDGVGSVGLHELRLLDELLRALHVGHHQEAGHVHADVLRQPDVLGGDVGLGGVGGDAGEARSLGVGHLEVLLDPDPREHEDRQARALHHRAGGTEHLLVRQPAPPILDGRPAEAVPVGDLDRVDPGAVESAGHVADVLRRELVPDRVASVAQRGVDDPDEALAAHAAPPAAAMASPAATAAEVMMSRLPA